MRINSVETGHEPGGSGFLVKQGLGDSFLLRNAEPADAEQLCELARTVFDTRSEVALRDILSGKNPNTGLRDFVVVEDLRTSRIVSSVALLSQQWLYCGVPFQCGQPEFVMTLVGYRRMGLMTRLFEVIHRWSRLRGDHILAIDAKVWFYRQFGYHRAIHVDRFGSMTIDLTTPSNEAQTNLNLRAPLKPEFRLIRQLIEEGQKKQVFSSIRTDEAWEFEFYTRSKQSYYGREWWSIKEKNSTDFLGYVHFDSALYQGIFRVREITLCPGVSSARIIPALVAYICRKAKAEYKAKEIRFHLGAEHFYYQFFPPIAYSTSRPRFAWFVAIPNVSDWLNYIQSAMEQNLSRSEFKNHTGLLSIGMPGGRISVHFYQGKISINQGTEGEACEAFFLRESLLELICGWRRTDELCSIYPDCYSTPFASALLDSLFPNFFGNIWYQV